LRNTVKPVLKEKTFKRAYEKMNLSVRVYHKILKTARTIADLEKSEKIEVSHISKAVSYRALEKKDW
jgi:TIGR00368: Mg chelatase-like protein